MTWTSIDGHRDQKLPSVQRLTLRRGCTKRGSSAFFVWHLFNWQSWGTIWSCPLLPKCIFRYITFGTLISTSRPSPTWRAPWWDCALLHDVGFQKKRLQLWLWLLPMWFGSNIWFSPRFFFKDNIFMEQNFLIWSWPRVFWVGPVGKGPRVKLSGMFQSGARRGFLLGEPRSPKRAETDPWYHSKLGGLMVTFFFRRPPEKDGFLLGQWLNFILFGITYLVGKISRSNFFFQGPLAKWV